MTRARRIFTSYSHLDEIFKTDLDKHLAPLLLQGRVEYFNDRHIRAGSALYEAIDDNIRSADIILMLISADYVSSKSCQDEMAIALGRGATKKTLAIPVVVRACDWQGLPIGQLLSANRDGLPINSAPDRDVAWFTVVSAIKQILNDWDIETAGDVGADADDTISMSEAVLDEQAINATDDGATTEQWVYRKDRNDDDWETLKTTIENGLCSLADRDQSLGIKVQTRRWGDKIIIDFRLPKHRNPRRILIADVVGYTGYSGYQLEIYPRDGNTRLPSERLRWLVNKTGERALKRLHPLPDQEYSPTEYAEHVWKAIKALVKH